METMGASARRALRFARASTSTPTSPLPMLQIVPRCTLISDGAPERRDKGAPEPERGVGCKPGAVLGIRIFAAAAVAAIGLSVAACGASYRSQVSSHGSTPPTATTRTTAAAVATHLPQAGYRGVENFCAGVPLSGHVLYDGSAGRLVPSVLTVAIGGLPPDSGVYVDWSNDHIRGYIIASFSTDSTGTPIPSSVSMGRLAEVQGVEMVLESVTIPPTVFGRLQPC